MKADLAALEARLAPLQSQIDRLDRQFWVTKAQVVANKYDLSASRYRQAEQDEAYYEAPRVTLERFWQLEQVMDRRIESTRRNVVMRPIMASEQREQWPSEALDDLLCDA